MSAGVDDIDQIRNLLGAYAERLDLGDLDGVAALFARARFGSAERAVPLTGTDQIRHVYDPVRLYDGIPRTKHLLANTVIEIDVPAATAQARCAFTVLQATPGFALQPILCGRYHDRFRRFADGWWFTERLILPDLRGDLRHHFGAGSG
jgi:hypothetical protein